MHSGGSPATTGAPPSPVGAASLSRRRRAAALAGAAVLLALSATVSLAAGSRALPTVDVLRVLVSPDGSDTSVIVRELRLPRTVLGLVVGAALGVAGAQLQGLTRNALADPGLLGVAAGAALAVVATSTVLGVGGLGGQAAAAVLGALGAEVIHVESIQRMDGIRGNTALTANDDLWWEWAPPYLLVLGP